MAARCHPLRTHAVLDMGIDTDGCQARYRIQFWAQTMTLIARPQLAATNKRNQFVHRYVSLKRTTNFPLRSRFLLPALSPSGNSYTDTV